MKMNFACACLALACLLFPGIAGAQSDKLAGIAALIQQGKLDEAESQLHQYLLQHPQSAKANTLLGTVYLREKQFEKAEAALQKAIQEAPALREPRLSLGDAYTAEGKLDPALGAYQGAAKIAPHDTRANIALAKLYLSGGEFGKSIEAAGNIPAERRTTELLPTLAADYLGLKEPEKANLEIQSMLQVADKNPELIPELAEFFLASEDFKSSQELLQAAKSKQPATDRFQVDVARTQAGLGQLGEAQVTLEAVLEHNPQSLEALVAAGHVASLQMDWAASEDAFTLAAKLAPQRPDILYGLVSAQLRQNETDGALASAQQLHLLFPDDLRATYLLALAELGAKKLPQAKSDAEKVLEAHPDDREMNLVLADVAFNEAHNLPDARRHLAICLKQSPDDPSALYYLGMIQRMEGDVKGAAQSLMKSVNGNPKNGDAQGALGALCLQIGDVACALRALEQAVLLAPQEAQNHYQLALAYSRSGAAVKAKAQLDIYQQMKATEAKDAKALKGPSTSEVPAMGITAHP
jgi:tetratricopeptide (TPR) repeat protein